MNLDMPGVGLASPHLIIVFKIVTSLFLKAFPRESAIKATRTSRIFIDILLYLRALLYKAHL